MFKEGIAKFLKLDNLMENLTGYVETRIEIMKYDLKEDLSRIISKASILFAVALTVMFFLLFISMAVAMLIGEKIGYFGGFGIVSLIYVVIALIVYVNRDSLGMKLENKIKEVIKQKEK